MKKRAVAICLLAAVLAGGCSSANAPEQEQQMGMETAQAAELEEQGSIEKSAEVETEAAGLKDLEKLSKLLEQEPALPIIDVAIDESGQVPIVMFHNFVPEYAGGDKSITTTLAEFEKLLYRLYEEGYRTVSMAEYISGKIEIARGCTPIIFTFDDGTSGQFSLVENNGQLEINPYTAVGVMEKFNETHPDFALKGVFYVNLGWSGTFSGAGTLAEKLTMLTDKGFEVHNHTLDHVFLNKVGTAGEMEKQLGGNERIIADIIPGYKMRTLALPYGSTNKALMDTIIKGAYEGQPYENEVLFLVGAQPSDMFYIKGHDVYQTPRIKAQGIEPIEGDLTWWLNFVDREKDLYVSDGIPEVVTIPEEKLEIVEAEKIEAKGLILSTYKEIDPEETGETPGETI